MPNQDQSIQLLPQQEEALNKLKAFCNNPDTQVFILTGYAGTGKTTLQKAFVDYLAKANFQNGTEFGEQIGSNRFIPLASTGRAAKILSDKIGQNVVTVHSRIYTFNGFNRDIDEMANTIKNNKGMDDTGDLFLEFSHNKVLNDESKRIYIVDEASMIGDQADDRPRQAHFGSGKLLSDLFTYDPDGKFVFVGDDCQLPPIEGDMSPALSPYYIESHFNKSVATATLTEIVRQAKGNDIVNSAERVRKLCKNPPAVTWGKFPMRGYHDIHILGSQIELIGKYVNDVEAGGYNKATLITGSNKMCNTLANMLRRQLGFNSPTIMKGELLLVTQNSFSTRLMNGDFIKITSIGNRRKRANLTFLEIEAEETSTGMVFNTLMIEDLLYSGAVNLSKEQQKALFLDFIYREKDRNIDMKHNSDKFAEDMRTDPYLNALRAVYGYAITCHKSQGGEWDNVYLDIPRYFSREPDSEIYQWLYTAMTRARKSLFVVNDFFIA